MGLLACSMLNICINSFICIYYYRCHVFHLQPLCLFLLGHGSSMLWSLHWPFDLILRPHKSSPASPFHWRGWGWSFRITRYGGCCICTKQKQQWIKHYSRRHRVRNIIRARSPAVSEHPIKTEACIEHIPSTWRPFWRQPDVLPGGAHCIWSARSRLWA